MIYKYTGFIWNNRGPSPGEKQSMIIRPIKQQDLSEIRSLVKGCAPLGFHSLYSYWVLNYHFNDLFLVAEEEHELTGFICGLISGRDPDTAFIWQIGVHNRCRGRGVSQKLIGEFFNRAQGRGIKTFLVSIDRANSASLAAFRKYADSIDRKWTKIDSLSLEDSFSEHPDQEDLFSLTL